MEVPGAEALGFTGSVLSSPPISAPGMGGLVRTTCFYQQWIDDPTLTGPLKQWQSNLANFRTVQHMSTAFRASEMNARLAAEPLFRATPMPWLEMYPTTPFPMFAPSPGPAPMLQLWDPVAATQALMAQAGMLGGAPGPALAPVAR